MIPHFSQVNEIYAKRYNELGGTSVDRIIDYPFIQQLAADVEDVQIINPLKLIIDSEENGIQMYFENDPHLTDVGQKTLAHFIEKKLFP